MRSILHESARPARPATSAPAREEPVSVVAALMEALTDCERYRVFARDGELFIRPACSGVSRMAKRTCRPIARPAWRLHNS
jgi:hypothetical protein